MGPICSAESDIFVYLQGQHLPYIGILAANDALAPSIDDGIRAGEGIRRTVALAGKTLDIKVASNGRMVLPLSVRKAMGLHGDAKVILTLEDDQVRLSPIGHGVSRAQPLYREHAKDVRTTDTFLSDRKAEAVAKAGRANLEDEQREAK